MELQERPRATDIGLPDASLHIIRDMILLALDATEAPNLPEANRIEALDTMEGRA